MSIVRRTAAPLIRRAANPVALSMAARYGGGNNRTYDFSGMFKRELTTDEKVALDAQNNRVVTTCVPGKLFMVHWIAAEQASFSITFRGIITIALMFGIFLGSGIITDSISIYSWWQGFLIVYAFMYVALHYYNVAVLAGMFASYAAAYLLW